MLQPKNLPTLEEFRDEARRWLSGVATPRKSHDNAWGEGSDSVALFDNLDHAVEARLVDAGKAWERARFDAGWGAISWPIEEGGLGYPAIYSRAFDEEERNFDVPRRSEIFEVTRKLIPPTILKWGTDDQKARWNRAFLRTDEMCCQLFSEPGAGSDLAGVATKATRDGDDWVLAGQKVWTSGARFSEWGLAVCRTDSTVAKHAGLTAFMVPLSAPGVTVRPIRQMSGGSSFSEVFLDDVRLGDEYRLGPEGSGWDVALTTLSAERIASNDLGADAVPKMLALAKRVGVAASPLLRHATVSWWSHIRIHELNEHRVAASLEAGDEPGPEGSIGRLYCTQNLTRTGELAAQLLGPRLVADVGEWGTFAWSEQFLGAPGYRIAGGSQEIQRNIIAERVLGLPKEPK